MSSIAQWFGAKSHRATILNAIMLTVLLALIGNAELFKLVGGITILLAAAHFVWRAAARTFRQSEGGYAYRLTLLWVPGLIAILLSVMALRVITNSEPGSLSDDLAIILFGFEIPVLIIGGSDPDGFVSPVTERG